MEIGPIFRSMLKSRARTVLIVLEIGLTLAVVCNCLALIGEQRASILRPTGIDEAHIVLVRSSPFDPEYQDDGFVHASAAEDLRTLNEMPGVRAAATFGQVPLSGGGSSTSMSPTGEDEDNRPVPYFTVRGPAVETLGVEIVEGRDLEPADFPDPLTAEEAAAEGEERPHRQRNILMTRALADAFFPAGDALGQTFPGDNIDNTIVGIIDRMHCSWPLSDWAEHAALLPSNPANARQTRYLVRLDPDAPDDMLARIEAGLLAAQPGRIIRSSTMTEIKDGTYRQLSVVNRLLGSVSLLLVAVTAIGIVGLTSFSVTQRTRQIGTRRALGATRAGILRYFLVESTLIAALGLTLGVVLTYALNFGLAQAAQAPRVDVSVVALAAVALWLIGLLATLFPAIRGASISPVVATRSI